MSDDAGYDTADGQRASTDAMGTSPRTRRAFGRRDGGPPDPATVRKGTRPSDGVTHPLEIRARFFLSEIF